MYWYLIAYYHCMIILSWDMQSEFLFYEFRDQALIFFLCGNVEWFHSSSISCYSHILLRDQALIPRFQIARIGYVGEEFLRYFAKKQLSELDQAAPSGSFDWKKLVETHSNQLIRFNFFFHFFYSCSNQIDSSTIEGNVEFVHSQYSCTLTSQVST